MSIFTVGVALNSLPEVRLPFTKGIFCVWAWQCWIPCLKSSVTEQCIPKWIKVPTFYYCFNTWWRVGVVILSSSFHRSRNTTKATFFLSNLKAAIELKVQEKIWLNENCQKRLWISYEHSKINKKKYLRLTSLCKVRKCIAFVVDTTSPSLQIGHFVS